MVDTYWQGRGQGGEDKRGTTFLVLILPPHELSYIIEQGRAPALLASSQDAPALLAPP